MFKRILSILALACAALHAEPVKINVAAQTPTLLQALAALDGQTVILDEAQPDGTTKKKPEHIAYDFGKDSVKIRLAIRRDLLAIREAQDAFEVARAGYALPVFGVTIWTADEYAKFPAEKRQAYEAKVTPLFQSQSTLDLALFNDADVTAMAGAGIPGTVAMALDPLVAKVAKAGKK